MGEGFARHFQRALAELASEPPMRSILEIAQMEFCPRPRLLRNRDSDWAGGQNELKSREH